jgi:dsDNA-binding SOS-regulon protein
MTTTTRFNEVTNKLNGMFKGSDEKKDKLVSDLKSWLKSNTLSEDKVKVEAIKCFLADNNIY